MKLTVKKATTSKVLHIFISDGSATDGSGLTGLVYNSAGLTAYYVKPGDATATVITLADITTLGTYVSGGFKEYDSTNMPGLYEFHPPDACLTTADQVVIMLKGATNMAPLPIEIQLDDNTAKDVYDRLGAPAGASIAADLVVIDNFVDELETRLSAIRAGYLDNLNGHTAQTADHTAGIADIPTVSEFNARTLASADYVVTTDTLAAVTTVTNLTNAPTNGDLTATMKASVQTEADTALASIDLDHLIEVTAGAEEPTDGSYLDQIMHKGAGQTFDATTDSLEALRDTAPMGSTMVGTDNAALAATALTDAIWTNTRAGYLDELSSANLPSDIDDILADTAEIGTAGAGLTDLGGMSTTMKGQVEVEVSDGLDNAISSPTANSAAWYLQNMMRALANKQIITKTAGANQGDTELFGDDDVSDGTVATAFTEDSNYVTRLRLVV